MIHTVAESSAQPSLSSTESCKGDGFDGQNTGVSAPGMTRPSMGPLALESVGGTAARRWRGEDDDEQLAAAWERRKAW